MPIMTVRRARLWLKSVKDQVPADVGRVVQASKPDLMARGVAFHLEQIDSYAPGHQVRFGSLNYTADIRGDLIFDGFEPMTAAPRRHDKHDLNLSSECVQEIAHVTTLALDPE